MEAVSHVAVPKPTITDSTLAVTGSSHLEAVSHAVVQELTTTVSSIVAMAFCVEINLISDLYLLSIILFEIVEFKEKQFKCFKTLKFI